MVMVGLPACLGVSSDEDTLKLRTYLRDKFGVEVSIYYRPLKDGEVGPLTGYTRMSYQVYNRVGDYYKFRTQLINSYTMHPLAHLFPIHKVDVYGPSFVWCAGLNKKLTNL
ncbi:hypothetical protein V6N13_067302 [Hibiscus sabdariffa]